jgi:uncharacterized lipoprotein (TIGR02269 family)
MRRMNRHSPALRLSSWLLCALLIACAASPHPHSAEEPLEEVFSSFEEGCADPSTVVLLCEGHECGFFRCRDLDFESGGVQLTRGGGGFMASPAAPGRRPGRRRGGLWPNRNTGPVLTFRLNPSLDPKPPPLARLQLPPGRYVRHHLFSQARDLAEWFKKQGVNIHGFTMVIEETVHHRIHSGGPRRGGRWNEAWRQFMNANPNATPEEIYRHAGEMIYRFELLGPIVPYYSRQR